jgi:hypothetical protein
VMCNTYSNQSWPIVGQGMFFLCEITLASSAAAAIEIGQGQPPHYARFCSPPIACCIILNGALALLVKRLYIPRQRLQWIYNKVQTIVRMFFSGVHHHVTAAAKAAWLHSSSAAALAVEIGQA